MMEVCWALRGERGIIVDVSAEEERLLATFLASTFDTFAPLEGFQNLAMCGFVMNWRQRLSSLTTGRT